MRGIANAEKRRAIFNKHRPNADLLILQETHSSIDIETCWQNEWEGKVIYSHGTTQARGVMMLTSNEKYPKMTSLGDTYCWTILNMREP